MAAVHIETREGRGEAVRRTYEVGSCPASRADIVALVEQLRPDAVEAEGVGDEITFTTDEGTVVARPIRPVARPVEPDPSQPALFG